MIVIQASDIEALLARRTCEWPLRPCATEASALFVARQSWDMSADMVAREVVRRPVLLCDEHVRDARDMQRAGQALGIET